MIATYPERAKVRNARRNQEVSVVVLSDDFGGPWVQVDGTAEVLDVPEAVEPLVEYFRSISGEHPDWEEYRQAMVRQGKSLLRVTPVRWGPVATGGFPPRLGREGRGRGRIIYDPPGFSADAIAMADCRHDRIGSENGPSPLSAGRTRSPAMEARRALGVQHPPPDGAYRHQPAGTDQACGQRGARVLRGLLRAPVRRAAAVAGGRRRTQRGHVGHRRRVARADHRPVPAGLGALRRHHRHARAGRDRSCAVVAG